MSAALTQPARAALPGRSALGGAVVAALGIAAFYAFPDNLGFLTRILATGLFTLSIYLVTGLGGVATLGHAVVFGGGAYAAGYAGAHGVAHPLAMLAIGGAGGCAAGVLYGAVLLRARGLPQLVLSIAAVQLAAEAANKFQSVTGGSDGLTGIDPGPLLGFDFDLYGRVGYLFALAVLAVAFAAVMQLERSAFGLTCRAIQADEGRMRAMGVNTGAALLRLFAISGLVAGLGGALQAIATGVVGLDSVGFELSANTLVMAVLGGLGSPWGALVGTVAFMTIEHEVAAANPYDWLVVVGLMLIVVVRLLPGGLASLAQRGR